MYGRRRNPVNLPPVSANLRAGAAKTASIAPCSMNVTTPIVPLVPNFAPIAALRIYVSGTSEGGGITLGWR